LNNVEFPDYKAALRAWVEEAIPELERLPNGIITSSAVRRWGCDNDGIFRSRERPVKIWNLGYRDRLQELSTWATVVAAVQANHRIGGQLDDLVGTAQSATRIEAISAGLCVLPFPDDLSRLNEAFEEGYADLETYLCAEELDSVVIWPLPGLSGEPLPIELETNLELGTMSDLELTMALEYELVRPSFPGTNLFSARPEDRACVRYQYHLPKVIGPDAVGVEISQALEAGIEQIAAVFQETMAVVLPEPITTVGRMTFAGSWRPRGSGVMFQSNSTLRNTYFRRHELDRAQADEILEVWKVLRQRDFQRKNKGLALALRRLSYQAQRERSEDELLDIMIAAEALYLSEVGNETERGDLRYRLSLRAAFWVNVDEAGMGRRDVFKLMRSAYDARSAVAHGGTPKSKEIKVRGETSPSECAG
jgi:hypothetical protein